jgi:hypothetical protein
MFSEKPNFIAFPKRLDEAVIALSKFLETFMIHLEDRYFAQIHHYTNERP